MRNVQRVSFIFLFAIIAGASSALAQAPVPPTSFLAGAGPVNFDLSGTGTTPTGSVRVSRDLGSGVVVEGGLLIARPVQQFGGRATLLVPEVQLQYHWTLDRFSPYVGGGIGAARVSSDVRTDWDPAVSFGGGTRIRVSDRVGVFGEFRLRGLEWDFVGTTADVIGGIVLRVGR